MTFAQSIDPRWHRRHPGSRRIGERGLQTSSDLSFCDHAGAVRAALPPFSDRRTGIITFSHPNAQAIVLEKAAVSTSWRDPLLSLPLRRAEGIVPLGRVEIGSTASLASGTPRQVQQPGDDAGRGWTEELLGFGARVLALSVRTHRRELLCDRKDPFAHLMPSRLAFTMVKSGVVVAAPLVNQAILENPDQDDEDRPSFPTIEGGESGDLAAAFRRMGVGPVTLSRTYVNGDGELVVDHREREGADTTQEDVMRSLSKNFEPFPALALRKALHNVMTVSTQRILEWQAVMHLSPRTADRLTKNNSLSALRKTERMSRRMAAAKMTLTAGKSLFFQNLALFIVDEIFLAVSVGLRERRRWKENPYACVDWASVRREIGEKSLCNFSFAFCIWAAGTLGTVVGTLVYPNRGPELLSILAEMGASTLLS